MKKRLTITAVVLITSLALSASSAGSASTREDDLGAVVKLIEHFYHVKHQTVPLLARASMKAATTAARIKGGEYKRLAEAGSVRVAFFEDQVFDSRGRITAFKTSLTTAVAATWSPLIQTLSAQNEDQTYIFVRSMGEKFSVLVVTIESHDAVVVQADLKPHALAMLLRDPEDMGKAITDEATKDDNQD